MSNTCDRKYAIMKFFKTVGLPANTAYIDDIHEEEQAENWLPNYQADGEIKGENIICLEFSGGTLPLKSYLFTCSITTEYFVLSYDGEFTFDNEQIECGTYPEHWGLYKLYNWNVRNFKFFFTYTDKFNGDLNKIKTSAWKLCRFSYLVPKLPSCALYSYVKCTSIANI